MSERSPGYNPKMDNIRTDQKEDIPLDLSIRSAQQSSSATPKPSPDYRFDSFVGHRIAQESTNRECMMSQTVKDSLTMLESVPESSHGCGKTEGTRPLMSTTQTQSQGIQTESSPYHVTSQTVIGMSGGLAVDSTVIGTQEVHSHHEDGRFKSICQSTMQIINRDSSGMHVSTYAERSALRNLKKFGSIFIKGRSGSGKSRLGRRLLAEMQMTEELQPDRQNPTQVQPQSQKLSKTQIRTPVMLTSPAQWDLIPKDEGKYTVLIDDIFGSSNIIQSQVDDWTKCFEIMTPFVESGHIFLVITSRPEISANCENRLKRFSILKNEMRLDEGVYELRNKEKIRMLRKICNGVTFDKKEFSQISHMKTKLGFPQCCKYFSCSRMTRDKGLTFFAKPHAYILDDVRRIQECDGVGYLALVLVLMQNGCLSIKHLIQSQSDLLNRCQQYCRSLPERITPADVKHKLESLCGVYLRKMENVYEFQHQSIYEAVFLSISHESPAMFIRHCPVQMLLDFVRTTRSDEDSSDTVVCIDREYYDELADRITQLFLSKEHVHCVVNHPCLKEDDFIHNLVDRWIKIGYLSHIMATKLDRFQFPTFYKCGFHHERCLLALMVMKNLHTLVRLLLRNCDTKIKTDVLPWAILMGNNAVVNSIIESGILPDTFCFTALRCSGDINNDLTDRIFNHVISGLSHPTGNASCPAGDVKCRCHQENLPSLSDVLLGSVSGENSYFVELLVDKLMLCGENSRPVFSKCLVRLFEGISAFYSERRDITKNTVKIAKKLLGTGCDVDIDYLTWVAAGHPDAQLLKVMLQLNVDIWKKYGNSRICRMFLRPMMEQMTSLEHAVSCGGYECVKTLLDFISIHDLHSRTRLKTTLTGTMSEHQTGDGVENVSHFLHQTVKRGDEKKLAILIDAYKSVEVQDSEGNTLLHEAVKSNATECVKLLLASHASVNIVNCAGMIPLQCIENHQRTCTDIVKRLVETGSNVNHIDKNRNTALSLAVVNNDIESVRVLVENGADVNYNGLRGQKYGCGHGKSHLFPCMSRKSLFGTVLHLACQYSDVEIVQILCEHRARMDVTDRDGDTVLHIAAGSDIDAMEKLQYITSCLDDKNNLLHKVCLTTRRTALFPAVISGDLEVVEFLLNEGIDVNHCDKSGYTALTYVCSNVPVENEILKILLQRNADPNVRDTKGCISLHHAVNTANTGTVALLLDHGADLYARDKENRSSLHYAAKNGGGIYVMKMLLKAGCDVDAIDSKSKRALHFAAKAGDNLCVKLLLDTGADANVQDQKCKTPLHYAARARASTCVHLLLEKLADHSLQDKHGKTPMHYAAAFDSRDSILSLLAKGADPRVQDKDGLTPIHYAIRNTRTIQVLLDEGADPCVQDKDGLVPIHYAAKTRSFYAIQLLLDKGAPLCVQDKDGRTALHYAVWTCENACVKLLLEKGDDPNLPDEKGHTALHYATWRSDSNNLSALLEKGADPTVKDKEGKTALHHAASHGRNITLLLEKGANPDDLDNDYQTALHCAAWSRNGKNVKLLLETVKFPSQKDKKGKTALHYAAGSGEKDIIILLLEKGVDQCIQDNKGRTALHYAVWRGNNENIKLLLENVEIALVQDVEGKTALHYAAGSGNKDNVILFLEKGVDQCIQDNKGRTALHYAAWRGNNENMKLLLENVAIALVQDVEGKTALHYAAGSGNKDNVILFLEKGVDQSIQDNYGRTALHYAVWRGNNESIKLLLENVAIALVQDIKGKTALHYAARSGNFANINLLLEKGSDPCIQDNEGRTALHYAACSGKSESVELLLSEGADQHVQDNDGKTALHHAVLTGDTDSVKALKMKGADPCIHDKEDKTALHYAAVGGNCGIMNILLEKSADLCEQGT